MDVVRYRKQILFDGLGEAGQHRLSQARVLVVGCGALGSVIAESVVRAGFGFVRLVDRDFVEISNLQRQVLYDEDDIAQALPKAIAAERKLRRISSDVTIEAHVADVDHTNIRVLADGVDLILDGTDNFEIRFLINDLSLDAGIPWINGGVIGSHGQVMAILPGKTPCLRCLVTDLPDPGSTETCDTAGVLGPAVNVVASLQVIHAMKTLVDPKSLASEPTLTVVDVWDGTFRKLKLGADLPEKVNCPACRQGERLWLSGERGAQTTVLCGRNAVQVAPSAVGAIDLGDLGAKLASSGEVTTNPFLVRLSVPEESIELTVFRDGRAIIQGTEDLSVARTIYARFIGS